MEIKCSVFIAASVDGFIARKDGDVSWLERPEYKSASLPGLSYDEFINTVDGIVMGRHSFEKVLTFKNWYYEGTPVTVLSSRKLTIPKKLQGKVSQSSGSPEEVVSTLADKGKKHLYIDGGITIQRFLKADLIDEMTITIIPVLLGDGIPLFGSIGEEVKLQLLESSSSTNSFVQTRYSLIKQKK